MDIHLVPNVMKLTERTSEFFIRNTGAAYKKIRQMSMMYFYTLFTTLVFERIKKHETSFIIKVIVSVKIILNLKLISCFQI